MNYSKRIIYELFIILADFNELVNLDTDNFQHYNIISDVINNEIMIMRCRPLASVMGVFMQLKQVSN